MTNNTIDIMLAHRSIRSFTDRTVSDENLDAIIRAVQAAPNWVNLQLVSMIVIREAERRKQELTNPPKGDTIAEIRK